MNNLLQMYDLKATKNRYAFANNLLIYAKGNNPVMIKFELQEIFYNVQDCFSARRKNKL